MENDNGEVAPPLVDKEPSDELFEHHKFEVSQGQHALRIDKYLSLFIENVSRNKIQLASKSGYILVNDIPVKPNYKVRAGDIIKVFLEHPKHEFVLEPEALDLDIVFEDDAILVVNKPSNLVVHPGHGNYSGTLLNGIMYHLNEHHIKPINSNQRPFLVHRIDKDTSGLLVVAKNDYAMDKLALQFLQKSIEREYICLVWGNPALDSGVINTQFGRDPKNRLRMAVYEEPLKGKEAITHYKVMERLGYVSLVSCQLETGRTHQIRVHMKHIGHTLFNDLRYGGDKILKGTKFSKYNQFIHNCFGLLTGQFLHARTLGFVHPLTKEKMRFVIDLPKNMDTVLKKWRIYSNYSRI